MSEDAAGAAPAAAAAAPSSACHDRDGTTTECLACSAEIKVKQDPACGLGTLGCCNGHFMCEDCSKWYVATTLGRSPTATLNTLPPKCMVCDTEIDGASFEKMFTDEQAHIYLKRLAQKDLKPGETMVECIACPYFEVWEEKAGIPSLFWCAACSTGHCYRCKAKLPRILALEDDDGFAATSKQAEIMKHMECKIASAQGADDAPAQAPLPMSASESFNSGILTATPRSPRTSPREREKLPPPVPMYTTGVPRTRETERQRQEQSQTWYGRVQRDTPDLTSMFRCLSMPI